MNQTVEELNKRELERCYVVMHVTKRKIIIGNSSKYLYQIFGLNLEGKRQYITSLIDNGNKKTSEWYDMLQGFKKRKLETIIYAVVPNDKSIREAVKLAYMDAEIIDSMEEEVYRLSKYIPFKVFYKMKASFRLLYSQKEEAEFEIEYEKFSETYLENEFLKDMLYEKINQIKDQYKLDVNLRKLLYGFYYSSAIYEKTQPKKGKSYEDMNEYLEEKKDYIKDNESNLQYTRRLWSEVINNVYLMKKELLIKYL